MAKAEELPSRDRGHLLGRIHLGLPPLTAVGPLARFLLLLLIACSAAVLPGSEGWAGGVSRGDRLVAGHRLFSAAASYETAARFPGADRLALVRLGWVLLRRGQAQEAAELFRRAESAGAMGGEVLLGLAEAQELAGDAPGSLATLRRELELRPANGEAWVRLVDRTAREGKEPSEIAALLVGIPAPVRAGPLGQRAGYLLGCCVLGADSEGGRDALRAAAMGADPAVAAMARELLDAAGSGGSGDVTALPLARTLLAQGLAGPALGLLERDVMDGGREAERLALRGYALARVGRLEEAEASLRGSLELAPERSESEFFLSLLLRQRGDTEDAARLLAGTVRREPGNPAFYAELANALVELGDYGNGERALRLAVESAPEDAELRLSAARFYVDRQYRVENGLEDAREAVRLSGRSAVSLSTLGWAFHLLGQSGEALGSLAEAVARDPGSPATRYRLGSVYEAVGRTRDARAQYLMVGELDGGAHWQRAYAALAEMGE